MLVKSNSPNGTSELAKRLVEETKTNEALSRVIGLLNDWMEEQKEFSADSQLASQEIVSGIEGLVKSLQEYFGRKERPNDTSVADAIKSIKFPEPQKINFEPLSRLASSIESQNRTLEQLVSKISQPQQQIKQDTSGYESLVRESLAAVARNNETMKSIVESIKKAPEKEEKENKPISYKHDVEYFQSGAIKSITTKPIS